MKRWSPEVARYVKSLFESGKADPENTEAAYVKSLASKDKTLKPYLSTKQGGDNKSNRPLLDGYRNTASEYITELAKSGVRRSECNAH